ncbi:putative manganese transporter [Patescibacteria group bacterium]|nr:putative manganese transporter [Patescibacteria group bacterium]
MFYDLLELVVKSATDSFVGVTVFVGAVLIVFNYFDYKNGGALIGKIERSKKWQPLFGALLGIMPGCGGAILLMPLYVRGSVSFGTVVATLLATAGDAAFVLLTKSAVVFLQITLISFVVALIFGYLVDYMNLDVRGRGVRVGKFKKCRCGCRASGLVSSHIGHELGDEYGRALHCGDGRRCGEQHDVGYYITHKLYFVYFVVLFVGLFVGSLQLFGINFEGGWVSVVGSVGVLVSLFFMIAAKRYFADDSHEEEEIKRTSLRETLVHNVKETSFVGVWIFVAFLAYEILAYFVGETVIAENLVSIGAVSIVIGALVGMIPGCGMQIIFVSLFMKGLVPFPALVAQMLSQDGDAMLPLICLDKRAAFWLTILTGFIGIVVGCLFLIFSS